MGATNLNSCWAGREAISVFLVGALLLCGCGSSAPGFTPKLSSTGSAAASDVQGDVSPADAGAATPDTLEDSGRTAADTAVLDAGVTDAGGPDTGTSDTSTPDTGSNDTGKPDTGKADTGKADTNSADTGAPDTGTSDTGTSDTGASDTGAVTRALVTRALATRARATPPRPRSVGISSAIPARKARAALIAPPPGCRFGRAPRASAPPRPLPVSRRPLASTRWARP